MKKTKFFFILLGLLLGGSVFSQANFNGVRFDPIGSITIRKYLLFINAVNDSNHHLHDLYNESVMGDEIVREEREDGTVAYLLAPQIVNEDASMLGLSKEDAAQYCNWLANSDAKYHLISNEDGSFEIVENEKSSPLMMDLEKQEKGGNPKKNNDLHQTQGDNRDLANRSRGGDDSLPFHGNLDLAASSQGSDAGGPVANGSQQGLFSIPAQNRAQTRLASVEDFMSAALFHFDSGRLVVCHREAEGYLPVIAEKTSGNLSVDLARNRKTNLDFKRALRDKYSTFILRGLLPGRSDPRNKAPLSSIQIFNTIRTIEGIVTDHILNKHSLSEEEWKEHEARKSEFVKRAVEFRESVNSIPEDTVLYHAAKTIQDIANSLNGNTTVTALGGVAITESNRDAAMIAGKAMELISAQYKKLAAEIATRAHFDYEKKFIKIAKQYIKSDNNNGQKAPPVDDPRSINLFDQQGNNEVEKNLAVLKEYWDSSQQLYQLFNKGNHSLDQIETINRSVPWGPINLGKFNPCNWGSCASSTEFNLVRKLLKKLRYNTPHPMVPNQIGEILYWTYSIRNNVHKIIMNRFLLSRDREKYVDRAQRDLDLVTNNAQKYREKYAGDNATQWNDELIKKAETEANAAFKFIEQLHQFKNGNGIRSDSANSDSQDSNTTKNWSDFDQKEIEGSELDLDGLEIK